MDVDVKVENNFSMQTYEVYKITNNVNNKIYIGITNQGAGVRFAHHLYESRSGSSFPIHNALRKYGKENFTLEIIELCETSEILKEREKYWIAFYNSTNREIGYNMTEGGDGTFGRSHSEETKEKIRQKALGRKVSKETKRKLSLIHKENYSEAHRKAVAESNKKRTKHVLIYDLDMNFVKECPSLKTTVEEYRLNRATLYRCIKNGKAHNNFFFKLKEAAQKE